MDMFGLRQREGASILALSTNQLYGHGELRTASPGTCLHPHFET